MPPQGTPKAPGKGARYTLPDEWDELRKDWSLVNVLEKISSVLASANRPIAALPSTQDVVRLIQEVLDVAIECLGEDHWAEALANPEIKVGETDTSVEDYHLVIDPNTGKPAISNDPDLGSSSPQVVAKPSKSYGEVTSQVIRHRRTRQLGKEPLGLYQLTEGVRALLASLPPAPWGPKTDEVLGHLGRRVMQTAESRSTTKGGAQTASGAELTIARMANQLRRLRQRGKGQQPGRPGKRK